MLPAALADAIWNFTVVAPPLAARTVTEMSDSCTCTRSPSQMVLSMIQLSAVVYTTRSLASMSAWIVIWTRADVPVHLMRSRVQLKGKSEPCSGSVTQGPVPDGLPENWPAGLPGIEEDLGNQRLAVGINRRI